MLLTDEQIKNLFDFALSIEDAFVAEKVKKAQLKKVLNLTQPIPSCRATGERLMTIVWSMDEYEALLKEAQ